MAEPGYQPLHHNEDTPRVATSSVGSRLARLVAIIPLAFLATFIGLYGLMVFLSGFNRDYFDTEPIFVVVLGASLMVVAALLAWTGYFVATNGRHNQGWLGIAIVSIGLSIVPFVLLVAGALRGGASLVNAVTSNVDHYISLLGWGGAFGRVVVGTVVVLALGSTAAYVISLHPGLLARLRRLQPFVVGLMVFGGLATVGIYALFSGADETEEAPATTERSERAEPVPTIEMIPTPALPPGSNPNPLGVPEFTDEHREAAVKIAMRSEQVRRLVGDRQIRSAEAFQWTSGRGEPIGSVVMLNLAQATTMDGKWLTMDFSGDEPSYEFTAYRAKYDDVTDLYVHVDLRQGLVVGVEPGPASDAHPAGLLEWIRVAVQRMLLEFLTARGITLLMVTITAGISAAMALLVLSRRQQLSVWLLVATVTVIAYLLTYLQTSGTIASSIGYPLQAVLGLLALGAATVYVRGGPAAPSRKGIDEQLIH